MRTCGPSASALVLTGAIGTWRRAATSGSVGTTKGGGNRLLEVGVDVSPASNGTPSVLTINAGTVPPGQYTLVVRATGLNGDAMHRPDAPAFNRPDVFAIDDWR